MAELGEIIGKLKKKIEYLKIAGGTASLVQVLSAHLHNKRKITKKKKTNPGFFTAEKERP